MKTCMCNAEREHLHEHMHRFIRRCDNLTAKDVDPQAGGIEEKVIPSLRGAMKKLGKERDKCVRGEGYDTIKICRCTTDLCNHAPSMTSYSLAPMIAAVTSLIIDDDVIRSVTRMLLFWN